jgi:hypothetical protein
MMLPSRHLPRVGDEIEIVHLGARRPAVIIEVEGRTFRAREPDGELTTFDLHPATGHFVRRGDGYWGVRARLAPGGTTGTVSDS